MSIDPELPRGEPPQNMYSGGPSGFFHLFEYFGNLFSGGRPPKTISLRQDLCTNNFNNIHVLVLVVVVVAVVVALAVSRRHDRFCSSGPFYASSAQGTQT